MVIALIEWQQPEWLHRRSDGHKADGCFRAGDNESGHLAGRPAQRRCGHVGARLRYHFQPDAEVLLVA